VHIKFGSEARRETLSSRMSKWDNNIKVQTLCEEMLRIEMAKHSVRWRNFVKVQNREIP
jgi:hypothetical protein